MLVSSKTKHTVLILGASGYIGHTIYSELRAYFETYGTYCNQAGTYKNNQAFFQYDVLAGNLEALLQQTNPSVIISCLKGDYKAQYQTHKKLASYVALHHHCRFFFLSSFTVFDAKFEYPSFENDKPASISEEGRFKISVEKLLLDTIPAQTTILRLPYVLGVNAPLLIQLRQAIKYKASFELYPNLIVSATTANKLSQQVHYLINKGTDGIYHLCSEDVIHHDDLFLEICYKTGGKLPVIKNVYGRNEDSYLALLPKHNTLPETYQITTQQVIDDCTLREEIITLKN